MLYIRTLTLLALAAGFLILTTAAFASPAPYVLNQQPLAKSQGKPDPTGPVKMTLIKAGQSKPVWSYTGAYPQEVTWAANGRALVLWFQPHQASDPPEEIDMLIWREGHKMATFHADDFNECDALWGFVWSPDNKRIAFRAGAAGSELNDGGTLYIYDLATDSLIVGPEDEVRKAQWVDPHTLQYWPLIDHTRLTDKGATGSWDIGKPKTWHVR